MTAVLAPLFAALLFSTTASAQELSPAERAEARALFASGQRAIDEGRWSDAVDSFDRAWQRTRAPSALFNTAFALRALGRYRDALRSFDELLSLDAVDDAMRAEATELRTEVRARIATVRLAGLAPAIAHTVRVDGASIDDDLARPLALELDPGDHALDVALPEHARFEWQGALTDGQTLDLTVTLAPIAAPSSTSFLEEPWLWIAIGAAVLVATSIAIWYADDQAQLRPMSDMPIRL